MTDVVAMESMISRWETSGLSLRRFGLKEGISYSRLVYWRRKLRPGATKSKKRTPARSKAEVELVPVEVVADEKPSSSTAIQLTAWLPNGVAVDVPGGFDPQELRRLVEVLSSC
jgi:hypothetical protein